MSFGIGSTPSFRVDGRGEEEMERVEMMIGIVVENERKREGEKRTKTSSFFCFFCFRN